MKTAMILAVLMLATAPITAAAAGHSKTQSLKVAGSVTLKCALSTSPISFNIGEGFLHSGSSPTVVQNSSIAVHCTKGAAVKIVMNGGLYGAKTTFGAWAMKSSPGNNYLGYNLCRDLACANLWTTAYNYTSQSDFGSSLPIYAEIKTGQSQVDAGSYYDTVTVTVNL